MIDANCQKVSAQARFDSDFRVRAFRPFAS